MIGIFSDIGSQISQQFENKFGPEVGVCNQLLEVYCSFLNSTSKKVRDNDYPNWTILILLSQTVTLMDNAVTLLSSGYLRSSEIMIRPVAEATILSIYFKEFPDVETAFRSMSHNQFFRTHRIRGMLGRVQNEGKIFFTQSGKGEAKQIHWNEIVFQNLYEESTRFVHNNPNLIYDLTRDQRTIGTSDEALIMGPQPYPDNIFRMSIRRILNTTLFSLVALGVSLNITPSPQDKLVMKDAQKIIEKLNHPK